MVIVDTSVWIEFFRKTPDVRQELDRMLDGRQVAALECIFGELFQGAHEPGERFIIEELWRSLPRVDRPGLWIEAGHYARSHRLGARGVGLLDTVLMVAALSSGADLWTLDRKLEAAWKGMRR